MRYTIAPSGDLSTCLAQRQLKVLYWMKNTALIGLIASLVLSLYAFRTDMLEAYTAIKSEMQVERISETTADSALIYFEPDSTNIFSLFKSNLAVLNRGTYKLYSPEGKELFAIQLGYSRPGLSISDNYVVAFDRGNRNFSVYEQRSLVKNMEAEGSIISLSQNKDGFIAVVHDDEAYRGAVSVYDNYQNLVYQWHTSDYYILRATVSPDGQYLAAVALTQVDGQYTSKLVLFRLDEEKRHAEVDIVSTLAADIHFLSDQILCVIGDNAAMLIDTDGNIVQRYDYGENTLKTCTKGNNYVILATVNGASGLGSKLVKLSAKGIGEFETSDEVRKISAAGNYIGVLYTSGIQMLNSNLEPINDTVEVFRVRDILTNGDGKLMLIYSAEAGYVDIITPLLP